MKISPRTFRSPELHSHTTIESLLLMDAYAYYITAMLNSLAQNHAAAEAPIAADAEFVPFDLSYLKDFPKENESLRSSSVGEDRNASDPLTA